MSMRYIIRRTKPDDLTDIRRDISNLDTQLNRPGENYRRFIEVNFTPMRSAVYQFSTRKVNNAWSWVCPCIELVAENEEGMFSLTEKFKVAKPSHLIIS